MKTEEYQRIVQDIISQNLTDVVIYMDVMADYIHVMKIDEYFDEVYKEGAIILREYDKECYIIHNGMWHKDFMPRPTRYYYMQNFRELSECMLNDGTIVKVTKPINSWYDVLQYTTWLFKTENSDEIRTYCPHNRTILQTVKDGMTVEEFKRILLERYQKHKHKNAMMQSKDFESKLPHITFNGDAKWFSMIFCEIYLLPNYANQNFIQTNKRMLCQYALQRIEETKKWQRIGIPTGFLKIGSIILMRDNTLRIQFELKINDKDD